MYDPSSISMLITDECHLVIPSISFTATPGTDPFSRTVAERVKRTHQFTCTGQSFLLEYEFLLMKISYIQSPVPTTIILEPNVSTYQYPGTHQERLEVPWTSVTFDTTVKTEKPSLTHAYNHDHRTIRSATTLSQGPVAKDPTFQQFERDHQEYPQVHDSISNTPQIERTDAVTFPFPIPITTHQVVHKEDSRIPPTPLNSNQNLPTESSPGAQNAAALRSKHRESVAMMPVSLNEDSTDRPHSRKERSRHNVCLTICLRRVVGFKLST